MIEEVFRGGTNKGLEEKEATILKVEEVTRVLFWNDDGLPNKLVDPLAQLDDMEGKWQTQRRKTRVSRKSEMVVELKLAVGKSGK